MKTNVLCVVFLLSVLGTTTMMAETIKSIQYRIENMHCGGCAGRVKKALNSKEGISKIDVDLEKRMVTIGYDADKITPEVIAATLTEAKYAPAPYSADEVIERSCSFKASQMHCGGCAGRVKKNMGAVAGVKSVDVDLASKSVKITYDANKVSRSTFKDDFKNFDYTVTAYYPNEVVAYAMYNVNDGKLDAAAEEAISKIKGLLDVTVNPKTKVIAVSYNTKVLADAAAVQKQLEALNYKVAVQ